MNRLCNREGSRNKFNSKAPRVPNEKDMYPRIWDYMPSIALCIKYESKEQTIRKLKELFSSWFFTGLTKLSVEPKEGIDEKEAIKQISFVMKTFETAHEDKEDAFCVLMMHFFTKIEYVDHEKGEPVFIDLEEEK